MHALFINKFLPQISPIFSAALILCLAGSASAMYVQEHESIVLKKPDGVSITALAAVTGNAFSMKTTCFGTAGCHGNGTGKLAYTYEQIESHNYHAQLGANEIKGFNPFNPDDDADAFRRGVSANDKNWVQSPGLSGGWCPSSARQMARLFYDGESATYMIDAGNARYVTNPFGYLSDGTKNPNGAFKRFNFSASDGSGDGTGDVAVFKAKVDNSVAGAMRDCGECHVGGGMMEYVNNNIPSTEYSAGISHDPAKRTSLRDAVFGAAVTAFNYFIDIFNPAPANRGDAVVQDYSQTGVLEMDCLMCHLQGYNWEARKAAVRSGQFDASRAAGAGLITQIVDGRTVFYNSTSVRVDAGVLKFQPEIAASIEPVPPSANCSFCHMNQYRADWQKRGEQWTAASDIHFGMGCMACHERTDKAAPVIGINGLADSTNLGLCDPAKGSASPFETLWNKLDSVNFRDCADCHTDSTKASYKKYGASDPTWLHAGFGLASSASGGNKIAYDKSGKLVSHLEIIDCTACHVRKAGFSGGSLVDGTGADTQGRLALYDEAQVSRPMDQGIAYNWLGGRLYAANLLTSFFWSDLNDVDYDVNNDGRTGGIDPLLPTHVNNINILNGVQALSKSGAINPAAIAARQALLTAGIAAQNGAAIPAKANGFMPRLSFLAVPFKTSHNVAKGVFAFGANGCKGCHAPFKAATATTPQEGGFFTGSYSLLGNMSEISYSAGQVANYTKVNGKTEPTDFHPDVLNKAGDRTLAVTIADPAGGSIGSIDRSQVLYESVFKARATDWYSAASTGVPPKTAIIGDAISADALYVDAGSATSTKGWLVKIEAKNDGDPDSVSVARTYVTSTDFTDAAGLLTAMGAFATDFEFTITNVGNVLTITPKAGKSIRLHKDCAVGPLGLDNILWKDLPLARNDKYTSNVNRTFTGRVAYVDYLNSIAAPAVAEIATINGVASVGGTSRIEVTAGNAVALVAKTSIGTPAVANGAATRYTWKFSDGSADVTSGSGVVTPGNVTFAKIFTTAGNHTVTLIADNPAGDTTSDSQTIYVRPANPGEIGSTFLVAASPTTDPAVTSFTIIGTPPTHTKVRISWGDGGYEERASLGTTLTHDFRQLAIYLDKRATIPDPENPAVRITNPNFNKYVYTTRFYLYDGTTLAAAKVVTVVLAPTSDLILSARMSRAFNRADNSYTVRRGAQTAIIYYLHNKGPGTNTGIQVEIPLPVAGLSILSATPSAGGTFSGTTWTVGNLAKGNSASLTLKVMVAQDAGNIAYSGGTITYSDLPDVVTSQDTPIAFTIKPYGSTTAVGGTTVGVATAVPTATPAQIRVTMPYTGNQNNNNSFAVKYKPVGALTWTSLPLVGHMPSPAVIVFTTRNGTGFASGGTFDIQVTYNDPAGVVPNVVGGVTYGATQEIAGVLVASP